MLRPILHHFPVPTPTARPSTQTIYNLGDTIINRLFHKRYNGHIIRYNTEDIIQLLNYVSTNTTHIPDDINTRWGDAIATISAPKYTLHKFGIRGQSYQQQNKQAIISSLIVKDNAGNITNKKLLRNMLPHKSTKGAHLFIDKCRTLREEFDKESTGILVLCDLTKHTRESMYFFIIYRGINWYCCTYNLFGPIHRNTINYTKINGQMLEKIFCAITSSTR